MPNLSNTFRNTGLALSLAALPFLLSGCTTSAPSGFDHTINKNGPLLQLKQNISSLGNYVFSNEYFWVYYTSSGTSGPVQFTAIANDYCNSLGGKINTSNPAKLHHKKQTLILNSCDLDDGPAFLYAHYIRDTIIRYAVAEKRSDVSQADFVSYLNQHGYQSLAQTQALKDAKNEALRKKWQAENEAMRKKQALMDAWYIPLKQKAYNNEVQRAKKASKGSKICELKYQPAWNNTKAVQIFRNHKAFLEEHSTDQFKILSKPFLGRPQTITWVKYGDYGLCD